MEASDTLKKTYQINKIFGLAMAGSLLLYLVIVEILKFREITPNLLPTHLVDKLRFIFVFFSFAAYFIIGFVNKKLLVKKPEDTHEALLAKLTRANIVSLALCELPALFGLVLFLSSANPRDFYLLSIISLLLLYAFFPRYIYWAVWSKGFHQNNLP